MPSSAATTAAAMQRGRALAGRERLELRADLRVARLGAGVAAAHAVGGGGDALARGSVRGRPLRARPASRAARPRARRRRCCGCAYACGAPSSAARSARAAASGSSASAIARTTDDARARPRATTAPTVAASMPPIANHGTRAWAAA